MYYYKEKLVRTQADKSFECKQDESEQIYVEIKEAKLVLQEKCVGVLK